MLTNKTKPKVTRSDNTVGIYAPSPLQEEQKELFYLLMYYAKEQLKEEPNRRVFILPIIKLNNVARSAKNSLFENLKVLHHITFEFEAKESQSNLEAIQKDKKVAVESGYISGYKLISSFILFHKENIENIKISDGDKSVVKKEILRYDAYLQNVLKEETTYQNYLLYTLPPQILHDLMHQHLYNYIHFGILFHLEKRYSIVLYEFLVKQNFIETTFSEMKELFDIDKHYKRDGDLIRKIIEPTLYDIQKRTGVTIFHDFDYKDGEPTIRFVMNHSVIENLENPLEQLKVYEERQSVQQIIENYLSLDQVLFTTKIKEMYRNRKFIKPFYLGLSYFPYVTFSINYNLEVVNDETGEIVSQEEESLLFERIKEDYSKVGDTQEDFSSRLAYKEICFAKENKKIKNYLIMGVTYDKKKSNYFLSLLPVSYAQEEMPQELEQLTFTSLEFLNTFVYEHICDYSLTESDIDNMDLLADMMGRGASFFRYWSLRDHGWRMVTNTAVEEIKELFKSEKAGLLQYKSKPSGKRISKKNHEANIALINRVKYAITKRRWDLLKTQIN